MIRTCFSNAGARDVGLLGVHREGSDLQTSQALFAQVLATDAHVVRQASRLHVMFLSCHVMLFNVLVCHVRSRQTPLIQAGNLANPYPSQLGTRSVAGRLLCYKLGPMSRKGMTLASTWPFHAQAARVKPSTQSTTFRRCQGSGAEHELKSFP